LYQRGASFQANSGRKQHSSVGQEYARACPRRPMRWWLLCESFRALPHLVPWTRTGGRATVRSSSAVAVWSIDVCLVVAKPLVTGSLNSLTHCSRFFATNDVRGSTAATKVLGAVEVVEAKVPRSAFGALTVVESGRFSGAQNAASVVVTISRTVGSGPWTKKSSGGKNIGGMLAPRGGCSGVGGS